MFLFKDWLDYNIHVLPFNGTTDFVYDDVDVKPKDLAPPEE